MANYGEQLTEQFQRKVLAEKLSQCTEPQQALFKKMYPNGPTAKQLSWAITQCQNTLNKVFSGNELEPAGESEEGQKS